MRSPSTGWHGELRATDPETVVLDFFDPAAMPEMQVCQRRSVERFVEFKRTGAFRLY